MARKTVRKDGHANTTAPVPEDSELLSKPWWLFLLAVAASLIAFGPALYGAFVFDDFHLPFAAPDAAAMPASYWLGGVRPVLMATYWVNSLLSGTDTFSYHAVNILLHAATAVLVYLILQCLFLLAGTVNNTRTYALTGAAIFLLHPLQTESVDYIAGRSEVVSGLLFCAAWLVFLRTFETETSLWTSVKILVLGGAAVLAKENAICLPAILFATDVFWGKRSLVSQIKRRLKLYVPFIFGAAAASIWILRYLAGTTAGFSTGVTPAQYALTQCRVILSYVRLFFVPIGQNGDWQLPFFHSLADGNAWIYLLGLLALILAAAGLYKRFRLISFGLLLLLLMLAPTSSVVPIKDAMAERRMYLPIIGLIVASIGAAMTVANRRHVRTDILRAVAIAAVLAAAALSWHRSSVWTGPVAFWTDSALGNPSSSRAHFGLGSALMAARSCKPAVREFTMARSEDPSNQEIAWNLAEALQCDNQPERALALFQSFTKSNPSADAWNQIAYTEARLGQSDAVFDSINKALSLDPNNATSYAYRGLARLAVNNPDGARQDFAHSLELDPKNAVALDGSRRLGAVQGR